MKTAKEKAIKYLKNRDFRMVLDSNKGDVLKEALDIAIQETAEEIFKEIDVNKLNIVIKIKKGFVFAVNEANEISLSLKDWREVERFLSKIDKLKQKYIKEIKK